MIAERLKEVRAKLADGVTLVGVSKYHPNEHLQEAYDAGLRVFGESHVQELVAKHETLPADIQWHFIGHLQTNKVKYIAPFISLIHAVDTVKLLKEIDRQAAKAGRVIGVLMQIHVAQEETKFGFSPEELLQVMADGEWRDMEHVAIRGIMCMASNTDDTAQIAREFDTAKALFDDIREKWFRDDDSFCELSMGMSGDYEIAQLHGSTMVRVGSYIFGERNY